MHKIEIASRERGEAVPFFIGEFVCTVAAVHICSSVAAAELHFAFVFLFHSNVDALLEMKPRVSLRHDTKRRQN